MFVVSLYVPIRKVSLPAPPTKEFDTLPTLPVKVSSPLPVIKFSILDNVSRFPADTVCAFVSPKVTAIFVVNAS